MPAEVQAAKRKIRNVLVTGGLGYIGSHAAVALAGAGYRPVIVDNLANAKASVLERIRELAPGADVAFHRTDVREHAAMARVLCGELSGAKVTRSSFSVTCKSAALAKADPDGYTIGVVFDTHAVNPTLIANLPFDTLRDLTPLMLVGTGAMALVTHVSQPYKSFRDVVAAAKAKPAPADPGTVAT